MISATELRGMAEAKLADAVILYQAGSYDNALYLCGYAIELILKARICDTLEWRGFPSRTAEFRDFQSFQTHDLKVLLSLAGIESRILESFSHDWGVVAKWDPAWRYSPTGRVNEDDCLGMIESSALLMEVI